MFHEAMLGKALRWGKQIGKGKGQKKSKVMPDELILLKKLTTESEYTLNFDPRTFEGLVGSSAKGLDFRNNFVISGMAAGVLRIRLNGTEKLWGSSFPAFWEDPNVFDIAAGAAALNESEAVASLWSGNFTLRTNEGIKIDKMPLYRWRTVQQTQASATTDNMQTGIEYKSLGAIIKMAGGNENTIEVRLNCKDKTHLAGGNDGTNDFENYLFFAFAGSVIKGGTIAEMQNN